jgi:alkylglycerol monooxygenase
MSNNTIHTSASNVLQGSNNAGLLILGTYIIYLGSLLTELSIDLFKKKNSYRFQDTICSMCCGLLTRTFGIYLKFITFIPYAYIQENYGLFKYEPSLLWSIIILLMLDLGYYIAHRASHDINVIWSGHMPHHSSEQYNYSTAVRQGVFEGPLTGAAYWMVALLGVPHDISMLHFQIELVYQFFVHTKFIGKLPTPIEYILNTPSHHRVHHGTNPKYIDKNYGGILIVWDRIFGTYEDEDEEVVYGVVRPLRTWSPLYANFHYLYDVLRAAWNRYKKTSLSSALNYLFRCPGWQPGHTKETKMQALEAFWEKRKDFKHDPHRQMSTAYKLYIISQTSFMLLALFTMTGKAVQEYQRFIMTILVMLCMFSVGRIMDHNDIDNLYREILRIMGTSVVLYMFELQIIGIGFGVVSLSLLYSTKFISSRDCKEGLMDKID